MIPSGWLSDLDPSAALAIVSRQCNLPPSQIVDLRARYAMPRQSSKLSSININQY